jgi:hypothetical protein
MVDDLKQTFEDEKLKAQQQQQIHLEQHQIKTENNHQQLIKQPSVTTTPTLQSSSSSTTISDSPTTIRKLIQLNQPHHQPQTQTVNNDFVLNIQQQPSSSSTLKRVHQDHDDATVTLNYQESSNKLVKLEPTSQQATSAPQPTSIETPSSAAADEQTDAKMTSSFVNTDNFVNSSESYKENNNQPPPQQQQLQQNEHHTNVYDKLDFDLDNEDMNETDDADEDSTMKSINHSDTDLLLSDYDNNTTTTTTSSNHHQLSNYKASNQNNNQNSSAFINYQFDFVNSGPNEQNQQQQHQHLIGNTANNNSENSCHLDYGSDDPGVINNLSGLDDLLNEDELAVQSILDF